LFGVVFWSSRGGEVPPCIYSTLGAGHDDGF